MLKSSESYRLPNRLGCLVYLANELAVDFIANELVLYGPRAEVNTPVFTTNVKERVVSV